MALPLVASDEPQPVLHPALPPHGDAGRSQRPKGARGQLRPRGRSFVPMRTLRPGLVYGAGRQPSRRCVFAEKGTNRPAWISCRATPRNLPFADQSFGTP